MTVDLLSSIFGVVVSLIFSYFPWVSSWFNKLPPDVRRPVMAGLLLFVVAGIYGYSCAGQANYFTCDQIGIWTAVRLYIGCLIANQATFLLSPQTYGHTA